MQIITCIVVIVRDTPHCAVIGYVYTPVEYRGRGYATVCVATITQKILTEFKKDFVVLSAQITNPISTHIYLKMGYKSVTDFEHWGLE